MVKRSKESTVWLDVKVLHKHLGKHKARVRPGLAFVEPPAIARDIERNEDEQRIATRFGKIAPVILLSKAKLTRSELVRRAVQLHQRAHELQEEAEKLFRKAEQIEPRERSRARTGQRTRRKMGQAS